MVLCAFVRDSDRAIARGSERERDKVVVVTRGGCAFEKCSYLHASDTRKALCTYI